jgi:hypothetical protein
MSYRRPRIPAVVERQLRQEAGFGCVRCGHPCVEYHHIVQWHEEQHFRPEDMVAVCGNCHGFFECQGRDRQYGFKMAPLNVAQGAFKGLLEYDRRSLVFRVGGNWYEDIPTILKYRDVPLISCRLQDNQALVSLNVFNAAGKLVFEVRDSEVVFRLGNLWDFECKKNIAIARSGPRDIALKMDFSGADACIEGSLWAGGQQIRLGPEHSNIG